MHKMKRMICAVLLLALLCACAQRSRPDSSGASSEAPQSDAGMAVFEPQPAPQSPAPESLPEVAPEPEPEVIDESWALLLVNAHNGLEREFAPALEEVQNGYRMDERAAPAMRLMLEDARDAGIELVICSAYRPYESQERNYQNSIQSYIGQGYSETDALAMTGAYIALPGFSEHQTGMAADIVTPSYIQLDWGFAETDAAKWLAANAPAYGFILRYPADKTAVTGIAYEPWHFRFVGETVAREITERGICLEEYLVE